MPVRRVWRWADRQNRKTKKKKTIFQSTCSLKGGPWLLRSLWRCPWRQSRCDLEEGATGTRGAAWHFLTNKALVAPGAVTPPATKQRHSYLTLPYLGVLELLWDHISLLGFVADVAAIVYMILPTIRVTVASTKYLLFPTLWLICGFSDRENYDMGLSF